jgi:hypothetical protein
MLKRRRRSVSTRAAVRVNRRCSSAEKRSANPDVPRSREAIIEILAATKPGLPDYFRAPER